MNTKNLTVSFAMIFFVLVLAVSFVSAGELVGTYHVNVGGINAANNSVSVVAGKVVTVEVYFTANQSDTDVTVEAKIEGDKITNSAISQPFDVEAGKTYREVLNVKVPFELKDAISANALLDVQVDGKNYRTDLNTMTLRVQRPSYNPVIESITTPSSINAGDQIPVEIVLKNMGYNNLDDIYVTASIGGLGVSQGPKWFGDLVTLKNCSSNCDLEDTVSGKLYLNVPYTAKTGVYTLEVAVVNSDVKTTTLKQISITNNLPDNVVSASSDKTVAKGEEASYNLLIVNPTRNVKVYKIVSDSSNGISSTPSQSLVAVPAGASKTVVITASSENKGSQKVNVNVFSNGKLVKLVTFGLNVEDSHANPVVILTIALAIIFLVLLVVLIVLLGKKPEKSEEFGESYY